MDTKARFTPDESKLAELILYIAQTSETDEHFGATKLNKLLWLADFVAYGKDGQPITGVEYQRLPQGPAPRRLLPVQQKLTNEQAAVIQIRERGGYTQKRLIALRKPDLSAFSGVQIALVDEVIRRNWNMSASEMSEGSHDFIGWKVVQEGETIPYETVFLTKRPLTSKEEEYARTLEPTCRGAV